MNKPLLILDLDETLIHSKAGTWSKKGSKVPIHNINIEGDAWTVIERPHLKDFINFILKKQLTEKQYLFFRTGFSATAPLPDVRLTLRSARICRI